MGAAADEYECARIPTGESPRLAAAIIVYTVSTWNRHVFWGGGRVPSQTPPPLICSSRLIFNTLANCVSPRLLYAQLSHC